MKSDSIAKGVVYSVTAVTNSLYKTKLRPWRNEDYQQEEMIPNTL
jgi:hypothetical protein